MSFRVGESRSCDGRDVVRVDERFPATPGRHDNGIVDRHQEGLTEVLHEPGGPHDRVRQRGATHEIQFDRSERDVRRGELDSVGAQVGDVPHTDCIRQI